MKKLAKLKNKNVVIIDGMNLFHRVYYTTYQLTSKTGYPTGAVFGFFRSLLHLVDITKSNQFIICWESNKKNWKKKKDDNYKANRNKKWTEDEVSAFRTCLRDVKQLANLIGILQLTVDNHEADDSIFYLVDKIKNDIIVVSRDKDMLQLVSNKRNVVCYRPTSKGTKKIDGVKSIGGYEIINVSACKKVFHGLTPKLIPYYLAIAGDAGDNVKGIIGYGEKRALQIINEYGVINNNNLLFAIPDKKHRKQFIDSLILVKSKSIIKRYPKLKIENFDGYGVFFQNEYIDEMIDDFGIQKYNTNTLRMLNPFPSFKSKIINKKLKINYKY